MRKHRKYHNPPPKADSEYTPQENADYQWFLDHMDDTEALAERANRHREPAPEGYRWTLFGILQKQAPQAAPAPVQMDHELYTRTCKEMGIG